MGIKVSTCNKTVNSLNCINCFECIKQCPKANTLTYGMVEGKIRNKKIAYGLCALLVLFFITQYQERIELDEAVKVEKDVTVGENITVEENVTENEDMVDNATYYIGTGTGYNGDIKVKVGVNNGNIINIKVLEHQDDYEWYSKAKKGIISQILEKQSTDVDNVSGATYSSQGIVQAVKDALENKVEAAE